MTKEDELKDKIKELIMDYWYETDTKIAKVEISWEYECEPQPFEYPTSTNPCYDYLDKVELIDTLDHEIK